MLNRLLRKAPTLSSKSTSSDGASLRGLRRTLGVAGYDEQRAGLPDLEFMSELEPPEGLLKFSKMEKNDPVIGGLMLRLKNVFSRVSWSAEGESAQFLQEQFERIPGGMNGILSLMASSLTFGFSLGEMILSMESGKLLLDDVAPRYQTSISSITSDVIVQSSGSKDISIPRRKCLHHVFIDESRSPYGVSLLRHVYKPYYYKINCEAAEATGIDRDLSGLPTLEAPEGFDFAAADSGSPSYDPNVAATLDWAVDLVGNVRKDSQQGVIIPAGWTFSLIRGTGSASINPTDTIQRYNSEIATGMLEAFALAGASNSRGNVEVLMTDFLSACGGFVTAMERDINDQVVKHLLSWNNLPPGTVNLSPPKAVDLAKLASFVARLVAQEVIKPTTALEKALLATADLPYEEIKK